ncbi:hypothetical protein MMC06_005336 [Schaereria dolodes]|nr:hypothetical protein [Schaereria dolodes]
MLRQLASPKGTLKFSMLRTSLNSRNRTRPASSQSTDPKQPIDQAKVDEDSENTKVKPKRKTMADLDEELRLKLEGISGEGGAAGLELEDGKPVAMKRGVKNNMFRLI